MYDFYGPTYSSISAIFVGYSIQHYTYDFRIFSSLTDLEFSLPLKDPCLCTSTLLNFKKKKICSHIHYCFFSMKNNKFTS